ncbi:MFS family permease [Litorivivens lipolytica]|uniref:MFS family permease n=1 Tax=Litorivivens lipolytica TaxID=1524264 RepID=A0A7W4W686_9GAMM|nr:MFS transporter [Litorivivens lipolytica]MBB3047639.1 MFS family permease [Litorivivens lipolytica]
MTQIVVALSALIISVVLFASGNAFVNSLLGVRMSLNGVDPMTIGIVLFFFALGFVIGSRICQRIIQRVGHIRAFAVFSACIAIAALAYPLWQSMWVWGVLRFASGIAAAGLIMTVESWFSCVATEGNRARLFSTYQIFFYSAVAGGQLLLQVAPPESAIPFSLAAILLVASLIPLAMSHMHSPNIEAVEALPMLEVYREAPLGVIASLINGVVMSGFYAMAPVYATSTGLNVEQISVFMSVAIMSAMVIAAPIGYFCDRHNRARVMLVVAIISGLAGGVIFVLGNLNFFWICAFTAVFFGLSASVYSIAVAITNDRMTQNQIVAASATLLTAYGIGNLVGPLLNAGVMDAIGPNGFFLANTALLGLLVVFILNDLSRVPPISPEEQEDFVAVSPDVLPVMVELDPRNEDYNEDDRTLEDLFFDPKEDESEEAGDEEAVARTTPES